MSTWKDVYLIRNFGKNGHMSNYQEKKTLDHVETRAKQSIICQPAVIHSMLNTSSYSSATKGQYRSHTRTVAISAPYEDIPVLIFGWMEYAKELTDYKNFKVEDVARKRIKMLCDDFMVICPFAYDNDRVANMLKANLMLVSDMDPLDII